MIAAELADGRRLVKTVVPRALLLQSAQLLSARLGGMLGRSVKHIPFSRKSGTTQAHSKAFLTLHKEVLKGKGLILALPEHLLSFKLSGVNCLSSNR
jgi:hypothetical protein